MCDSLSGLQGGKGWRGRRGAGLRARQKEILLLEKQFVFHKKRMNVTGSHSQKMLSVKNNQNNNPNSSNKMSPSRWGFCNYSVNCMKGLDEVLLAWRGKEELQLASRKQLLGGRAPAGPRLFSPREENRPPSLSFQSPQSENHL